MKKILVLTVFLLVGHQAALCADSAPVVVNSGFEQNTHDQPDSWLIETSAVTPPAHGDANVAHSGRFSLGIEHNAAAETRVLSGEINLQMGQLYRLTAWIKTTNVSINFTERYPTPAAATLRMASMPFTEHSAALSATQEWQSVSLLFFATRKRDRVELCFGHNGPATGTVWFDDVTLTTVEDIREMIPMETVEWFGPAFRYHDKGWLYVHIEGEPWQRGYQYGHLLSKEIVAFIEKLAVRGDGANPQGAWSLKRQMTDALMLRLYDEEYLTEMSGIADGVNRAGVKLYEHSLDLLDIAALNSDIDLGQMTSALAKTAHPLSGRSFRQEEEEINAAEKLHKCSSFLANGPASTDGKIVFGQLFMWNGYTGVHWNVICDVKPARGHRLVFETFPGGIHSGADFYINQAGIMIGETTVMQTPFDVNGAPQSNRIRKAAQYSNSIDEAVKILTDRNNGLYTNDWLIGDRKTDEIAILLLGTKRHKLWRSSKKDFPGNTDGFLWSVNNAKDPEVRKEYVPDPHNAPVDVVYSNSNRDLAFVAWYREQKGRMDEITATRFLATSPVNRPHACDGKVTTSDMAEHLMFWAHYGKVTLREKFPEGSSRLMPDIVNAIPHLTLGYSAVNPIYVCEQLQKWRNTVKDTAATPKVKKPAWPADWAQFDKKLLWNNTVYPATEADQWFVSATAAYWQMLNNLPASTEKAPPWLRDQLAEINNRLLFNISREGSLAPVAAQRRYDRYKDYLSSRIRGVFALHQLRLQLGNEKFSRLMNNVHDRFREKPMSTAEFLQQATVAGDAGSAALIQQWLQRDDLPAVHTQFNVTTQGDSFRVQVQITQSGKPWHLLSSLIIESEQEATCFPITVTKEQQRFYFMVKSEPQCYRFNSNNDFPMTTKSYYMGSNLFDEFQYGRIVYGTKRQQEAQHTLALRCQTMLADAFTEVLLPVQPDGDCTPADLAASHCIVLGGPADNLVMEKLCEQVQIKAGKNYFIWQGKTYSHPDDGLYVALPNPWNENRAVFLWLANSSLQLQQMTKRNQFLPSWAIFNKDTIVEKGFHDVLP